MSGRVLLYGKDSLLLNTRGLILSHAGFTVISASTLEQIASVPEVPAIQLGIIGHSVPEHQRKAVSDSLLQRWPDAKILFLTPRKDSLTEISTNSYQSGSDNPSQLVKACREILNGS